MIGETNRSDSFLRRPHNGKTGFSLAWVKRPGRESEFPLVQPPRATGPAAAAFAYLDLFGGTWPQPEPSILACNQPGKRMEGLKPSGRYAGIDELARTPRGQFKGQADHFWQASLLGDRRPVDVWNPDLIMSALWPKLREKVHAGTELEAEVIQSIIWLTRMSEPEVKQQLLIMAKSEDHVDQREALAKRLDADGITKLVEDWTAQHSANKKSTNAELKAVLKTILGKSSMDTGQARSYMIQSIYRAVPELQRQARMSQRTLDEMAAAARTEQDLNIGRDDAESSSDDGESDEDPDEARSLGERRRALREAALAAKAAAAGAAEAAAAAAEQAKEEAARQERASFVGRRVRKKWGRTYYTGSVTECDALTGFRVEYDDGDVEDLALAELLELLIPEEPPTATPAPAPLPTDEPTAPPVQPPRTASNAGASTTSAEPPAGKRQRHSVRGHAPLADSLVGHCGKLPLSELGGNSFDDETTVAVEVVSIRLNTGVPTLVVKLTEEGYESGRSYCLSKDTYLHFNSV